LGHESCLILGLELDEAFLLDGQGFLTDDGLEGLGLLSLGVVGVLKAKLDEIQKESNIPFDWKLRRGLRGSFRHLTRLIGPSGSQGAFYAQAMCMCVLGEMLCVKTDGFLHQPRKRGQHVDRRVDLQPGLAPLSHSSHVPSCCGADDQ